MNPFILYLTKSGYERNQDKSGAVPHKKNKLSTTRKKSEMRDKIERNRQKGKEEVNICWLDCNYGRYFYGLDVNTLE